MSFSIQRIPFDKSQVDTWATTNNALMNWPVVYLLDGASRSKKLYVGETTSAHKRMRQHLGSSKKNENLTDIRVVVNERYNKHRCRAEPELLEVTINGCENCGQGLRWNHGGVHQLTNIRFDAENLAGLYRPIVGRHPRHRVQNDRDLLRIDETFRRDRQIRVGISRFDPDDQTLTTCRRFYRRAAVRGASDAFAHCLLKRNHAERSLLCGETSPVDLLREQVIAVDRT